MEEKKIPIEVEAEIAGGRYSNLAIISHNENEFVMDFIFVQPPKGRVNARIIMSPAHAKRFLGALQENVEKYEDKFADIKEAQEPPKFGINFSTN